MSHESFELALPRHAFTPRDVARPGDVWRAFQDAAVLGSSRRGWPPARYTAEGCAFVVRSMTVVHHAEVAFGTPLRASTWVERFRRGLFSTRQVRLHAGDRPIASATQEWVHVLTDGGVVRAARASDALLASFQEQPAEPLVTLPPVVAPAEGPEQRLEFSPWFTWMDPLGHANHPAYLDWCEEALARAVHQAGLDPMAVVPVAEQLSFKVAVVAPEPVRVGLRLAGFTEAGDVVLKAAVTKGATVCAEATLVRRLVDGAAPLARALGGGEWR